MLKRFEIDFLDVANRVVELARQAKDAGTFGVGALLVHKGGRILHADRNRVLEGGRVCDPTAHAERRVIDWYFEQWERGVSLPPCDECIVVSSLDPCVHCAGAILVSRFKSMSLAADANAGIRSKPNFECVPAKLRETAASTFFGFEGIEQFLPVSQRTAAEKFVVDAHNAFESSRAAAQTVVAGVYSPEMDTVETSDLPAQEPELLVWPFSNESLSELTAFMTGKGKIGIDTAAFVDTRFRTIVAATDQVEKSPVRLALAELVRGQARARRSQQLSHARDCLLITHDGPADDATGLITLGAYGSMIEIPSPAARENWEYLVAKQPEQMLLDMIRNLPPLYSDYIKIWPKQAPSTDNVFDRHKVARM